jgi:hypothetical protein
MRETAIHRPRKGALPMPQTYPYPPGPPDRYDGRRPRRGRIGRFFRGYLMLVGALTTAAAFVLLLVRLFVEIEKWVNP